MRHFQDDDLTSIPAADRSTAIAPFSVANWVTQGNSILPDKRGVGYSTGDTAATASPLCGGRLATKIITFGHKTITSTGTLTCIKS